MSLRDFAFRLARPAMFTVPPETAHALSIRALASGVVGHCGTSDPEELRTQICDMSFPNPVGVAAGYDKNAEVPDALLAAGFGFAEVGTITPRAQPGNPRPRVFRLARHRAVINRLGFNNEGHAAALRRLEDRHGKPGIIGVNIGANKDASDFVADYEAGVETFASVATYFTANISSPNTPGLRDLQQEAALRELLARVIAKRDAVCDGKRQIPIFLKIAPDLTLEGMDAITRAITGSGLNGLIVSNTTLDRELVSGATHAGEAGGLSGRPVFDKSTRVLAQMRQRLGVDFPIVGVGGIDSAGSAIAKLEAGANLLQLYTGMIYEGPGIAEMIKQGLINHLRERGISSVTEMTGRRTEEWCHDKSGFE